MVAAESPNFARRIFLLGAALLLIHVFLPSYEAEGFRSSRDKAPASLKFGQPKAICLAQVMIHDSYVLILLGIPLWVLLTLALGVALPLGVLREGSFADFLSVMTVGGGILVVGVFSVFLLGGLILGWLQFDFLALIATTLLGAFAIIVWAAARMLKAPIERRRPGLRYQVCLGICLILGSPLWEFLIVNGFVLQPLMKPLFWIGPVAWVLMLIGTHLTIRRMLSTEPRMSPVD